MFVYSQMPIRISNILFTTRLQSGLDGFCTSVTLMLSTPILFLIQKQLLIVDNEEETLRQTGGSTWYTPRGPKQSLDSRSNSTVERRIANIESCSHNEDARTSTRQCDFDAFVIECVDISW